LRRRTCDKQSVLDNKLSQDKLIARIKGLAVIEKSHYIIKKKPLPEQTFFVQLKFAFARIFLSGMMCSLVTPSDGINFHEKCKNIKNFWQMKI
jgi:hypothetical protein